ncbi:MAG: hypothetical protein RL641_12 [Candidatus Parcubacteria bacterium]|jgi:biopolymer transport protein ExbB/TolQ
MDGVMKSEIFFFVATVALILLTVLLVAAFYYILRFLRKINRISDSVEDGVQNIKEKVKDEPLLGFLFKKKPKRGK